MYDLNKFTAADAAKIGEVLRSLGAGATSMEEVADRTVRYLRGELGDNERDERSCVLARFYKTEPYSRLPADLKEFTNQKLKASSVPSDVSCLTLLATVGDEPQWNSRLNSARCKVFPLVDGNGTDTIPMISSLLNQFGVEFSALVNPDPSIILDMEQRTYNAFYVSDAVGSPYIPAQQEFVIPYGVSSVLGFGGILMSGALFAIVLFSKTHIPRETAEHFKMLAPNVKQAVLPFVGGKIFAQTSDTAR